MLDIDRSYALCIELIHICSFRVWNGKQKHWQKANLCVTISDLALKIKESDGCLAVKFGSPIIVASLFTITNNIFGYFVEWQLACEDVNKVWRKFN